MNGQEYDVTTDAATAAINGFGQTLTNKVQYYQGYQQTFNQQTNSFMNAIIEIAGGLHTQPDAGVWDNINGEVNSATGAAGGGDIAGAVGSINQAANDLQTASQAWEDFLNHFYGGGNNVITGLGWVAKISITVEAGLITVATGGAGGAAAAGAIGAGNAGLSEAVDQWVNINQGTQHDFEWGKLGLAAVMGGILGAAGDAVQPKVAELLAQYLPGIVGANTAFLESLGTKFIDNETGEAMTAAAVATKLEPLWGQIVSKIPVGVIKGVVQSAFDSLAGVSSFEEGIKQIAGDISLDSISDVITDVLKEAIG